MTGREIEILTVIDGSAQLRLFDNRLTEFFGADDLMSRCNEHEPLGNGKT